MRGLAWPRLAWWPQRGAAHTPRKRMLLHYHISRTQGSITETVRSAAFFTMSCRRLTVCLLSLCGLKGLSKRHKKADNKMYYSVLTIVELHSAININSTVMFGASVWKIAATAATLFQPRSAISRSSVSQPIRRSFHPPPIEVAGRRCRRP